MRSSMASLLHMRRLIVGVAVVVVVIALVGAYLLFFAPGTQAAAEQPIAFNHKPMVHLGIQCLFCHTEARRSPAAGIPSVARCMGCHTVIAADTPVIKQVAGYWDRQEPIPWVRVNQLPRFVFFSHQVHIAAGRNCEECHGDVGEMAAAHPVATMNMGWCLTCHEQQPNAAQLKDCVVCHR
jgi:c(7)-type cytochrome triheme protein